jgi:hypothetical protein
MEEDRYFFEVNREQAELDMINLDLEIAADEIREQSVTAAYSEYLQAMLAQCYETDYTFDI